MTTYLQDYHNYQQIKYTNYKKNTLTNFSIQEDLTSSSLKTNKLNKTITFQKYHNIFSYLTKLYIYKRKLIHQKLIIINKIIYSTNSNTNINQFNDLEKSINQINEIISIYTTHLKEYINTIYTQENKITTHINNEYSKLKQFKSSTIDKQKIHDYFTNLEKINAAIATYKSDKLVINEINNLGYKYYFNVLLFTNINNDYIDIFKKIDELMEQVPISSNNDLNLNNIIAEDIASDIDNDNNNDNDENNINDTISDNNNDNDNDDNDNNNNNDNDNNNDYDNDKDKDKEEKQEIAKETDKNNIDNENDDNIENNDIDNINSYNSSSGSDDSNTDEDSSGNDSDNDSNNDNSIDSDIEEKIEEVNVDTVQNNTENEEVNTINGGYNSDSNSSGGSSDTSYASTFGNENNSSAQQIGDGKDNDIKVVHLMPDSHKLKELFPTRHSFNQVSNKVKKDKSKKRRKKKELTKIASILDELLTKKQKKMHSLD